jgi:hypothetical protein
MPEESRVRFNGMPEESTVRFNGMMSVSVATRLLSSMVVYEKGSLSGKG